MLRKEVHADMHFQFVIIKKGENVICIFDHLTNRDLILSISIPTFDNWKVLKFCKVGAWSPSVAETLDNGMALKVVSILIITASNRYNLSICITDFEVQKRKN